MNKPQKFNTTNAALLRLLRLPANVPLCIIVPRNRGKPFLAAMRIKLSRERANAKNAGVVFDPFELNCLSIAPGSGNTEMLFVTRTKSREAIDSDTSVVKALVHLNTVDRENALRAMMLRENGAQLNDIENKERIQNAWKQDTYETFDTIRFEKIRDTTLANSKIPVEKPVTNPTLDHGENKPKPSDGKKLLGTLVDRFRQTTGNRAKPSGVSASERSKQRDASEIGKFDVAEFLDGFDSATGEE